MSTRPFRQISRSFLWLHLSLFVGLPLAVMLVAALYWGAQRILDQAREKIELDFFALTTYLHTQERYLSELGNRHDMLRFVRPAAPHDNATHTPVSNDHPYVYHVRPSLADIPFALICTNAANCPAFHDRITQAGTALHTIGDFLSDFYAAYWSRSYFPGATTFLIDLNSDVSLRVPADDGTLRRGWLSARELLKLTNVVRQTASSHPIDLNDTVLWFRSEDLNCCIIGLAATSLPSDIWPTSPAQTQPPAIYAATLLDVARTNLFDQISSDILHDGFWLLHGSDSPLVGSQAVPDTGNKDTTFKIDSVIFRLQDQSQAWTGVYQINYGTLFHAHPWLPTTALMLLLTGVIGGVFYARWYRRRIISPLQNSHQALLESEAFNRTLLETAPVALCVAKRDSGEVLFANHMAQQWLDLQSSEVDRPWHLPANLLSSDQTNTTNANAISHATIGDRTFQVVSAHTHYHQQEVILHALVDISLRTQYEEALTRAKAEADSANAAKTRFLAAMSHEIRTPLYGILGTIELLSMGQLSNTQQQHLHRLQQAASTLKQLISDILDLTKIEANQMPLHVESFCPRRLVQSCVDSFSSSAFRKGLQLFSCIETDVPEWAQGDPVRIKQVLYNFLGNAVKFTSSGHIIARLRMEDTVDGMTGFIFQVVDTGPGISTSDQQKLFTPFYQATTNHDIRQGTGLGLSICENLARLMGGHIQLISEPGLGSSFSLHLRLPTTGITLSSDPSSPNLHHREFLIRSSHAELSQNICSWFTRWGAHAKAILPSATPDTHRASSETILLDVLFMYAERPGNWPGRYIVAGLSSHSRKPANADLILENCGAEDMARQIERFLSEGRIQSIVSEHVPRQQDMPHLGLRVLAAEDNPINQATLKEQLEQLGCTVTMTADGTEALLRWSSGVYDVVLTDVNMPRMNGYELTKALRDSGADVPIIGVTANAMRQEEDHCRLIGMNAWIVKPIDLATLHRQLSAISCKAETLSPMRNTPANANSPLRTHSWTLCDKPSEIPENLTMEVNELSAIPVRHRALFRESMLDDAKRLIEATHSAQPVQIRHALHRMHGALLTMQQRAFSARISQLHDDIMSGTVNTEQQEALLQLAHDLVFVIQTHLPTDSEEPLS